MAFIFTIIIATPSNASAHTFHQYPYWENNQQVSYGENNNYVKAIQAMLVSGPGYHISIDGAYGPETLDAVKNFQSSNGLTADGIIGPKTWTAFENPVYVEKVNSSLYNYAAYGLLSTEIYYGSTSVKFTVTSNQTGEKMSPFYTATH